MSKRVAIREYAQVVLGQAFPTVLTDPKVDMKALKELDPDPWFLTLPIAEVGRVSENGLHYDEGLVSAIQQQIVGNPGIRGHIPDSELATAMPLPAVYWVGVRREGKTLYAKAYVPPGPTRDDLRIKDAIGGKVGTSIFAHAIQESDRANPDRWYARQTEIEQVDLAAPQRAALRMSGDFLLTRETRKDENNMGTARHSFVTTEQDLKTIDDLIARVEALEAQVAALTSGSTEGQPQPTMEQRRRAERARMDAITPAQRAAARKRIGI